MVGVKLKKKFLEWFSLAKKINDDFLAGVGQKFSHGKNPNSVVAFFQQ